MNEKRLLSWCGRLLSIAFMLLPGLVGTATFAAARRLYDLLAVEEGGFIGYVEEYSVIGMSVENYRARGEAFPRLDCARA